MRARRIHCYSRVGFSLMQQAELAAQEVHINACHSGTTATGCGCALSAQRVSVTAESVAVTVPRQARDLSSCIRLVDGMVQGTVLGAHLHDIRLAAPATVLGTDILGGGALQGRVFRPRARVTRSALQPGDGCWEDEEGLAATSDACIQRAPASRKLPRNPRALLCERWGSGCFGRRVARMKARWLRCR